MPVQDVIGRLSNGTYEVTRTARGARNSGGYYVSGSASTVSLGKGIVHPVTSSVDVKALPDGQRREDSIVIYSRVEMMVLDDNWEADQLEYRGATYKIVSCDEWRGFGGVAYRAYGAKQGTP